MEDKVAVSSIDGSQVVRLEYEEPELAKFLADWCNGGSKGRKLRITADDIEVLDTMGRRPLGTHKRLDSKTGRNDPCPCGSGKKFKKCCGRN